jgi:hypothetical protein
MEGNTQAALWSQVSYRDLGLIARPEINGAQTLQHSRFVRTRSRRCGYSDGTREAGVDLYDAYGEDRWTDTALTVLNPLAILRE